jgi:hypothetical protein
MVTLMQKEETFEVEFQGMDYMVTIMTDITSGYIQYDVYGPDGEILDSGLEVDVIRYTEDNIN